MKFDKCEGCLHSRAVISENGLHYVCCLSPKKAIQCQSGHLDAYTGIKATEAWNRRVNDE